MIGIAFAVGLCLLAMLGSGLYANATTAQGQVGQRPGDIIPLPLTAVQVYQGCAAAVVDGVGLGLPLTATNSAHLFVGVFQETYNNTLGTGIAGSTGYYTRILRTGLVQWAQTGTTITDASRGKSVYFADDHTITLTPGTTLAGVVVAVDQAGLVWVDIGSATKSLSGTSSDIGAGVLVTNVAGAAQTFTTYSVPANLLKVGSRIRVRGQLVGTTRTASDTCALALVSGATTLFTLASAFAHATTNFLYFDVELVVQAIGASGSVVGAGFVNGGTAGATTTGLNLAATTLATNAALPITLQGTFSASNTTDQITVNIFDVDVTV
jgi:hypothetical protein